MKKLSDLLPYQEHYWLFHNGKAFGEMGNTDTNQGLLVFADRTKARQFYKTVGQSVPDMKPVKVSIARFMALLETYKSICLVDGLKVVVCSVTDYESPYEPSEN